MRAFGAKTYKGGWVEEGKGGERGGRGRLCRVQVNSALPDVQIGALTPLMKRPNLSADRLRSH